MRRIFGLLLCGGLLLLCSALAFAGGISREEYQKRRADLRQSLDGVMVLKHEGAVSKASGARSSLYFSADAPASSSSKVMLTFIPYYAWLNRKPSQMQVWTPLQKS